MCPGEQAELPHVILLDERQNEPDESNVVQTEAYETVVGDQPSQEVSSVYYDSKIIHDAFSIKEIIGSDEKVPRQRPEPW